MVIDAVDGLHPEMEFTYRPFAGDDAAEAFRKIVMGPTALKRVGGHHNAQKEKKRQEKIAAEQDPKEVKARLFGLLVERVDNWSLDRPLLPENINRLHPKLFARFKDVVLGDDIPDWKVIDGERVAATEDDALADAKN